MSCKAKIIIIHGTCGSPNTNWFPWLKEELIALDCEVIVPTFPTPRGQSLTSWTQAFREQTGSIAPNTILIGHSLGAGFILNLLEECSQPVLAIYLICGFIGKLGLSQYDPLNESFVCREFNWPKIKKNMGHAYLFSSDNDPYVPHSKSKELALKLGVSNTVIPGAQHINEEAGYKSFPLLLQRINSCLISVES